jgi:hypothetical protein
MGDSRYIVGDEAMVNDPYAAALGFRDAAEMDEFCMSLDATPWLERLARRSPALP